MMSKLPTNLVSIGIANLEDDALKYIFYAVTNRLSKIMAQKNQSDSIKLAFIYVYCGRNISAEYRERFAIYNNLNPYNQPNAEEETVSPLARVRGSQTSVNHKRTFAEMDAATSITTIQASMSPAHRIKQQKLIELAVTSVVRPITPPMPFFEKKYLTLKNQLSSSAPQPTTFFQDLALSSASEPNPNLSEQHLQLAQVQFRSIFD